jgi:hypothetical protein
MQYPSFLETVRYIERDLRRKRKWGRNGPVIQPDIRLSAALRYA